MFYPLFFLFVMKNKFFRFFSFFISILFSFLAVLTVPALSFPVHAASPSVLENFVDFLRTNLGFLSVSNGSLGDGSREDFTGSLYNTQLTWYHSSEGSFSFIPSDIFSLSAWNSLCLHGYDSSMGDARFENFTLQECLERSGYISSSEQGLSFSGFPALSDCVNASAPLDGVEVITNFSSFNYGNPSNYVYLHNCDLMSEYVREYDNFLFINGDNSFSGEIYKRTFFYAFNSNYYYFLIFDKDNDYNSAPILYIYDNSSDKFIRNVFYSLTCFGFSSSSVTGDYFSGNNSYVVSGEDFSSSGLSFSSTQYGSNIIDNSNLLFYSNNPVVVASSYTYGINYYYWKNYSPFGIYYTTTNIDNSTYSTEYITNNNWENAYNNYLTDVSNYYSTTENIDNSTLSQYIDKSTTITNITNNYLDNSSSGGDDDIITNSWLERIYQKLSDFFDSFISYIRGDVVSSDGDTYITDNYVTNEIYYTLPQSVFPNVPVDNLIGTAEDFTVDLFTTKMAAIASEVVPFCFLFALGVIATSFSHSPSPPYWELPFNIETYGIKESVVIDLTGDVWNNIHTVWITLFMIIFIAFLFYLTTKIINMISNLLA